MENKFSRREDLYTESIEMVSRSNRDYHEIPLRGDLQWSKEDV